MCKKYNSAQIICPVLYVKVSKNKFTVKHIDSINDVTLSATKPFTTTRLLVGQFMEAEALLKKAINMAYRTNWLPPSPIVVIQPIAMAEGRLSEVEERVLRELAAGAGAHKIVVWGGHELTNEQVLEKAHNK